VLDSPEPPERLLSPSLFSERAVIQDQARGCGLRIVKLSNSFALDDWGYDWLPNYSTIVRIHEEEIKARLTPRVYEEYMLGLSRYLWHLFKISWGETCNDYCKACFDGGGVPIPKDQILKIQFLPYGN
jgi:hypothetical protein